MYRKNGINFPMNSCHSWREQTQTSLSLYGFYDPKDKIAFEFATKWGEENDECAKEGGIYCDSDQRVLWGSCSKVGDPDDGICLGKGNWSIDIWLFYMLSIMRVSMSKAKFTWSTYGSVRALWMTHP